MKTHTLFLIITGGCLSGHVFFPKGFNKAPEMARKVIIVKCDTLPGHMAYKLTKSDAQ